MTKNKFPALPLGVWEPTKETLQLYTQVVGKIRQALTPARRHWSHVSLRPAVTGLTTSPIAVGSLIFEIRLDMMSHKLVLLTNRGEQWHNPLHKKSPASFCEEILSALARMDIQPDIDHSLFDDEMPGMYDDVAVERYWLILSQIAAIFEEYRGTLRGETSPVQLWPHHFDLAMLWFSGRLVPGVDPEDEEQADEQMNFGFVPGDEGIPDPYFYITAYPQPEGLLDTPLPEDVTWHTEGFTGAVMMYESLVFSDNPKQKLLNFLQTVHSAGQKLMKD